MSEVTTDETPERDGAPLDSRVDVESNALEDARAQACRVLLVADEGADEDALGEKLTAASFEVERASAEEAARRVEELAPSIILLAFGGREGEGRMLSLARRLRMEPSSFALPVVLVFNADSRSLRSAAQHLGADDYFARDVPGEEMRARLASLLWRAESGRRSAPSVADQRSEIDNFLFLLDAVGTDARSGMTGSLALVEAGGDRDGEGVVDDDNDGDARRATALTTAHGFLKLNLRRVDAVAFYGPATLLVHLAGADSASARATLSRLREEFSETNGSSDLFVGISSFPADGTEVERLVEQAEAALRNARGENSVGRVVVYGVRETRRATDAEQRTQTGSGRRKMKVGVNEPGASLAHEPSANALKEPATRSAAAAQLVERRAGGRLRRVMLVVSDAARMAQVNLLMRSAAYEVRAAFDGQHALNLLRIDRPDALVVDYALNEMNGVEMLKQLVKQSRTQHAPPAMMLLPTGREDLRKEALAAGARGVVEIPYDAIELLDMLRELCDTE
jgi:two-component system chemotaxis response regulator CheY